MQVDKLLLSETATLRAKFTLLAIVMLATTNMISMQAQRSADVFNSPNNSSVETQPMVEFKQPQRWSSVLQRDCELDEQSRKALRVRI